MPRLTLSLLGPFQATLDGKPITDFESDRVRALLAYLAVEADRPHRRDWAGRAALARLARPVGVDQSAQCSFQLAQSDRRPQGGCLPSCWLIARRSSSTRPAIVGWTCRAFRALTAPDQPARRLEEGISLYRGSFLEGFGLGQRSF